MSIFQKFFGDVMSHINRKNTGKRISAIAELVIKQKIVFNFVSPDFRYIFLKPVVQIWDG